MLWRARAGVAVVLCRYIPDTTLFLTRRGNYARLRASHPMGQLKLFKFVPDEFVARCLRQGSDTPRFVQKRFYPLLVKPILERERLEPRFGRHRVSE